MGIVIKVKEKDFSEKKVKKISFVSVKSVESISAVFVQGDNKIYETTSLNSLKELLTVTATYSDSSTGTVTNYTLSGTLTEGVSVITVTYEGKTTTFNVLVSHLAVLSSIEAVYTQGQTLIYANTPLNDLKEGLVVTAYYDDETSSVLIDEDYNLSGTLTVGTSTITVSYGGETDTFDVVVSSGEKELVSISAVYTQGQTEIYPSTALNDLKQDLVVTATYDDSSTATLSDSDYTLSGTLTVGTSTVTVSYSGETTTFSVTVSAEPGLPVEYQKVEYLANTDAGASYVETGLNFIPSTDTLEIDFEPTGFSHYVGSYYGCPFGDYFINASTGCYGFITGSGEFIMRVGKNVNVASATDAPLTALVANTKYNLKVFKDDITIDGVTCGTPDGTYASTSQYTMVLFGSRQPNSGIVVGTSYFEGKIYSFKIYRNNTVLHNFVPCYRKSDNVIGMYDIIAQEFKVGTGSLAKGSDV